MTSPVTVTLSLADSAPKLTNFGTIAFFAKCPYAGEPQTYTADSSGLAAMVDDGFSTDDEAYIMLSALSAQADGQSSAKIYPRDNGNNAQEYTFTPTKLTAGAKYTLGLKGPGGGELVADYTVESGDTAADICDGLIADIVAQTPALLTVSGTADGSYTARIDGTNYTYVAASDTTDEIGAGLTAAIAAGTGLDATHNAGADTISITHTDGSKVTVTSVSAPSPATLTITTQGAGPDVGLSISAAETDGTLVLTPTNAGERFWVNEFCAWLTLADTSTAEDLDDDLAAALEADPDFYGFCIDSTCPGEHALAHAFAIANGKMFVGMTVESEAGTSSDLDVATDINDAAGFYSKLWYHKRTKERADVALMGKVFGHGPAYGWHSLRLQGVTAPRIKGAFAGYLDSKLVGYVTTEMGLSFTYNTKFPGRYPDLVRGFDWFKERVHAACLKVFVDSAETGGVTFDDPGIGKFVSALLGEARVGIENDLLAAEPAPTVVAIAAADVSTLDKAARRLPEGGMVFNATIKGKVESLPVEIVVTP